MRYAAAKIAKVIHRIGRLSNQSPIDHTLMLPIFIELNLAPFTACRS